MSLRRQATSRSHHVSVLAPRSWVFCAAVCTALWQLVSGAVLAEPAATAPPAAPTADEAKAQPDAEGFVRDDQAKLGSDWVRLARDENGEVVGMQTAIVRYASPDAKRGDKSATVDLVGAVHIGDAAYYAALNDQFTHYDALLYELVAPEGTTVERGRGTSSENPVGALQNGAKSLLGLDHQLALVDYTKKNFVHADISPTEFLEAMKDRNESFLEMYFRLLGQSLAQQSAMAAKGESMNLELLSAMFSSDRPRRLKIALAKQLAEMESLLADFGGPDGSVLISERNKRALAVLKQQLEGGKKRLGIFYGAGHLADMDQRLQKDFGLRPVGIKWLTAWDLTP